MAMVPETDRLKKHIREIVERIGPRDATHPGNLHRVARYIGDQLEPLAVKVSKQPYRVGSMTVRNVRAFFGPDTEKRIVVGAHYDVAGPRPGADDNASGVAGLIELGRLLSMADPPMRTELVAYPLEEPPYFHTDKMGSWVHARSLKREGIDLHAMLGLEMIGYFTDEPRSQSYPLFLMRPFYPSVGNFIAVIGNLFQRALVRVVSESMKKATPLPVESLNAPKFLPGVAFSDHVNYWKTGYRAVMITDTAFYRNPNYHLPSDTPDTLDYRRMAHVVRGVHAAVLSLARSSGAG